MQVQGAERSRIDELALLHPSQGVGGCLSGPLQLGLVKGHASEHFLDIERLIAQLDGSFHGAIGRLPGGTQHIGEQIGQPLAAIPADHPHAQCAAEQDSEPKIRCRDNFHDAGPSLVPNKPTECSLNGQDAPFPVGNKVTAHICAESIRVGNLPCCPPWPYAGYLSSYSLCYDPICKSLRGEEENMIGRLRGVIIEKQPPEVLIEVGGLGYEVHMPMSCFYDLPELGKEAVIHTHFVVREDAQLRYGVNHKQERALFRELIKTNGVGPKLALAILSGMTATQFVMSVEREEISSLVKLPGVGKKTAERLVVEMKDRLKGWVSHDLFSPAAISLLAQESQLRAPDASEEAASALVALGYKPQQASQIVAKVASEGMSVEAIIRESLRSLV